MTYSGKQQPISTGKLWTARVLKGIAALFMLFDAVIHLIVPAPVVESFTQLGIPIDLSVPLGINVLVCVALYLLPRTSILGAVLLTGYLGGAIAIQARVHAPLFSATLFPLYIAIIIWGGIFLVDERLRVILPFRKD
jgi:hypothetical protein